MMIDDAKLKRSDAGNWITTEMMLAADQTNW